MLSPDSTYFDNRSLDETFMISAQARLASRYNTAVLALLILLGAEASYSLAQLPDLRPEIENLSVGVNQSVSSGDVAEGCAAAATGRTLVRFDNLVWNDGPGTLALGDPQCPNCDEVGVPVCGNPLFECSAAGGHNHAHLRNFTSYEVLRQGTSEVVVRGHKEGYCLINSRCLPEATLPEENQCNVLAAGCADVYPSGLGCQYVDVTGLAPGKYLLRVSVNPLLTITEANYANNLATYQFELFRRPPPFFLKVDRPQRFGLQMTRDLTFEGSFPWPARVGNRRFDPRMDGLQLTLEIGGYPVWGLSSAQLPPIVRGKGCMPKDGWVKRSTGRWEYRNDSLMSADCLAPLGNVSFATVTQQGNTMVLRARARVEASSISSRPTSGGLSVTSLNEGFSANETKSKAVLPRCDFAGPGHGVLICRP